MTWERAIPNQKIVDINATFIVAFIGITHNFLILCIVFYIKTNTYVHTYFRQSMEVRVRVRARTSAECGILGAKRLWWHFKLCAWILSQVTLRKVALAHEMCAVGKSEKPGCVHALKIWSHPIRTLCFQGRSQWVKGSWALPNFEFIERTEAVK